jgi:thioredoxin reductase
MSSAIETDVVIIGAGPAGITAAIQLKRYGISFVLLEKGRVGGLLWNANLVENYPGFPNGISGPALVALLVQQMARLDVEVRCGEAVALDYDEFGLLVNTRESTYHPRCVVVATGTQPRPFSLPVSPDARGRVVRDVMPLLDVEGKHVAIIGAGDAAFDHALNMAKKRNSVTILNRGPDVQCLSLLKTRVDQEPAISYRGGIAVREVKSDKMAGKLQIECQADGQIEQIEADFLVLAIGRDPQLDFLSAGLRAKEQELMNQGRLYFVGDVHNGLLRQMAIAAGDGLRAAMQIEAALREGRL